MYMKPLIMKDSDFQQVCHSMDPWCATRSFKRAISDYLVRGTDLIPLECQIKNDHTQHNNSHPV